VFVDPGFGGRVGGRVGGAGGGAVHWGALFVDGSLLVVGVEVGVGAA